MYRLVSTTSQSMYCSLAGTRKLIWYTGTKEDCEAAKRRLEQWLLSDEFEIIKLEE